MMRINNLQIYCLLILATAPLSYLVTPAVITHLAGNSAWLAVLAALIPGALLIYVYIYILKKSIHPFPAILEDCLGKIIGKIVGFAYILVFLMATALTLRIFTSFIGSSIVPDTPLSVYIGLMLLTGYYALRTGLENIARISQVLVLIGMPAAFLILLLVMGQHHEVGNLLPLLETSFMEFGLATYESFIILGNMIAVLTLAYFSTDRDKIPRILFNVMFTYIFLIALSAFAITIHLGAEFANLQAFPTFKLIRSITIADFIQNIDAAFIALWIIGIFGAIMVVWFMTCYVTQQVFALKDYRFIAAPTSVIIGILTLMMGSNIEEEGILLATIFPIIYGIFYVFVPLVIFFILLFKPAPAQGVATGLKSPTAQSGNF